MKTEKEIRAEYDALYAITYERAVQSGLPEETAKQLAERAVAEKAPETINKIINKA